MAQSNEFIVRQPDLLNDCSVLGQWAGAGSAGSVLSIVDNIGWLTARGYGADAYHLAYPNGGYDDSIIAIAESIGIRTGRTIVEWTKRGQYFPLESNYKLKIGNCLHTTAAATVTGWMDDAVAKGATLIPLYHKIVTSATVSTEHNTADFYTEMDHAYTLILAGSMASLTTPTWWEQKNAVAEIDRGRPSRRASRGKRGKVKTYAQAVEEYAAKSKQRTSKESQN